jgi:hypothetical protein
VIIPIEPTKEECPEMHTRAYPTFAQWFAGVWVEFQAEIQKSGEQNVEK